MAIAAPQWATFKMIVVSKHIKLSALLTVSVLLIACGGGGGGATMGADSPPPPNSQNLGDLGDTPSPSDTTLGVFGLEFNAQYGLRLLNVAAANDAGFTGLGIRAAVVDTGIDIRHSEFLGRQVLGRNFGDGDSLAYLSDSVGHGTHVAATLAGNRDGIGMRGVAYDALLYSYRISTFSGGRIGGTTVLSGVATDAAWAEVVKQHTTDRIQVSNNSWGSTLTIDQETEAQLRTTFEQSIPALVQAQQQGTIFVFAAGNAGAENPSSTGGMPARITELKPQWLVVVAVDENLRQTDFTNRCGIAADFCVTAPGARVFSARANSASDYDTLSGTSMAAPHVAGVVALIYQRFPELNAAEITTRVKATATLDNLTGLNGCTTATCDETLMRSIFGHGLVNAQAAMSPIGTLVYSTDGSATTTAGHTVGSTSLAVPANLGAHIASQLRDIDVAVFDSFDGATFRVSADQVFNTQQKQTVNTIGYSAASHAMHVEQGIAPFASTFATQNSGTPLYISFANNAFTAMSATVWGDKAGLMAQPTLMTDQAMQQFEWGLVQTDRLSVRPFTQFAQDDAGRLLGAGLNFSFRPTASLQAHVSVAQSQSYMASSITSTQPANAIAVNVAEFGLEHDLSQNFSVFARSRLTDLGSTQASSEQWGIKGGQIFQHHLGVEFKMDRAKLAIGAYDPGQMRNSQLALMLPDSRTQDGQVIYREQRFDVSQAPRIGAFLAAKAPIYFGSKNFGTVTFSIQQSPYESSQVGRAALTYAHQF